MNVDQIIQEGKVLVNVVDAKKNPLMGLGVKDFSVTQSGRVAKILSVKPIAESLDVPRHTVLVMDNSFSMQERNAVKPLLAGVDELLKTIRPARVPNEQIPQVVEKRHEEVKMQGASERNAEAYPAVRRGFERVATTQIGPLGPRGPQ